MSIVKLKVCTHCLSPSITDINCVCVYSNYKTIELEFEECECCNQIKGGPLDNEFNNKQLKNLNNEN
jgi:hypothetical protein